ncbi:hypothetical protein [Enterococcus songbeiensis]|uniref:hypothetical protein n=1 Tax=Enterococcus songbeiensis TaxID=2559927 RepID=UPI0010F7934F|nr:hypothetical protein [Enterococcus songbeiensis]
MTTEKSVTAQDKIVQYFRNRELEKEQAKVDNERINTSFLISPAVNTAEWIAYQSKSASERHEPSIGSKDELYQHYKLHDLKNMLESRRNTALEELKTVEPYRLIHETAADNYVLVQAELEKLDSALKQLQEYQHPNTVTTFSEGLAASMQQYEADMAKLEADKVEINAAELDQTEKKKTVVSIGSNPAAGGFR